MRNYLEQYKQLLEAYNKVIRNQYMDEAARTPLFKQMDEVWIRLSNEQRKLAVEYCEEMYEREIRRLERA